MDTQTQREILRDYYYGRLEEIALSSFEWFGLPKSVNELYLERNLFARREMLYFKDDVLGTLTLPFCIGAGKLDVYNEPIERVAISDTGYRATRNYKDSVIIYNSYKRQPTTIYLRLIAERLANCDTVCTLNLRAQKMPYFIRCSDDEKATLSAMLTNLENDGEAIQAYKSLDLQNTFGVFNLNAPYICDKVNEYKRSIWTDALSWLGVLSVEAQKKERVIRDEIHASNGGAFASRASRLACRQFACEKIYEVFGDEVWCEYRSDIDTKPPFELGVM